MRTLNPIELSTLNGWWFVLVGADAGDLLVPAVVVVVVVAVILC